MSSDVSIANNYPGITLDGHEQTPHPYFEIREKDGVLYRSVNAKFGKTPPQWTTSHSGPAFARAQFPDGTVKNLAPSGTSPWTAWTGNGEYAVFNVRDFGAVADGSTDDSDAFNNAALAANSAGGGIVYCPPGEYAIQYSILLYDNTELVGDYNGNTTILAKDNLQESNAASPFTNVMVANSDYLMPPDTGTSQSNIAVRNIAFNGNAANQENVYMTGESTITLKGVYSATVERCYVFNCANTGISVTRANGPEKPTRGNVRILDNTVDIMSVRNPDGSFLRGSLCIRVSAFIGVLVRGNVINYNPNPTVPDWTPTWSNDGIDVLGCSDVTIVGNIITLTVDGIGATDSIFPNVSGSFTIADNIIENYLGFGIRSFQGKKLDSAINEITITNNVVMGSQIDQMSSTAGPSQVGIHVDTGDSTTATHFAVSGNVVIGPFALEAINLGASRGTCTGNSLDTNLSGTFDAYPQLGITVRGNQISVTGNEISNGTGVAIATALQLIPPGDGSTMQSNVLVANNNIVACTKGVDIENNLSGCVITNNNVSSTTTALNIGSGFTLTNVRIADNLGINPPAPTIITQPPMTSLTQTNTFPFDCTVYVKPAMATITEIDVNGLAVLSSPDPSLASPLRVHLPVNGSVRLTYSGSPRWEWIPE